MKKLSLILFIGVLLTGGISCIKDTGCQNKSIDSERAAILDYASANGIIATAHSTGLYYQITNPGSGTTPSINSKVFVTYTGKLLNGTQFDAGTTPVTGGGWALSGLISGWQIGLPLIQKGGSIKLIIPSSMAYGCQGAGTIPANSILFFDITLNDVQ
ncbi:MAG: FKBP-type peptidyl-prolyl cis-trans isomerase [Bacteroidetes bacterium]|nr:FKBP-type peptidyl-prolyl cis-trans isomerase [Bacteroidota bacterium]